VLVAQFTALESLAPGRVIAGLGTGDKMSEQENVAYGVSYPPAAERRAEMVTLGRQLVAAGLTVWMAGGAAGRTEEARAAGAAVNLWDTDPAVVAERSAANRGTMITWAGPPPAATPPLAERVQALHDAGASWVVFGWPVDVDELAAAGHAATATERSGRAATGS
jgi:hypothetical protein